MRKYNTKEIFDLFDNGETGTTITSIISEMPSRHGYLYYTAYRIRDGFYKKTRKQKEIDRIFDYIAGNTEGRSRKDLLDEMHICYSSFIRYQHIYNILKEYDMEANPKELGDSKICEDSINEAQALEYDNIISTTGNDPVALSADATEKLEGELYWEDVTEQMQLKKDEVINDFETIFSAFKKMDYYVSHVKNFFDDIGALNIEQQKILHDMEVCKSYTELIELNKRLFKLRKERRVLKNTYDLSARLMNNLRSFKIHTGCFNTIEDNIREHINFIQNPPSYDKEFESCYKEKESYKTSIESPSLGAEDESSEKPITNYINRNANDNNLDDWKMKIKMLTQ